MSERKYHLEAARILAMPLVMFNHSPAYLAFQTTEGADHVLSLCLSIVCKAAVPLFLMISGALLLGKEESLPRIFRKRVSRIAIVLVLVSFLYYLKLVARGEALFSVSGFVKGILTRPVFLPYWYLYMYLGFLGMLPFMRAVAMHMTKDLFLYLLALWFVFGVVLQVVGHTTGWWYSGYFDLHVLFADVVFYPLAGYGFERFLPEMNKQENICFSFPVRNLFLLAAVAVSAFLVRREYLETGAYTETCFVVAISVITLALYLDCRGAWGSCRSKRVQRALVFCGDKVFGIYLLEGFLGTGGAMDAVARALSPFMGLVLAYLAEILLIFLIRLAVISILKKIPVAGRFL